MKENRLENKNFEFEIKTVVLPKRNETFQKTIYILKKNDVFEQAAITKLEALMAKARENPQLAAIKYTCFKEGVNFSLTKNQTSSNKDKLLVNKEKNVRRQFEKEMEESEKKDPLLEMAKDQASRVRVKIANIMFYEPEEDESQENITKYLDNQKEKFTSILSGMINMLKNKFRMEMIKTNVRNCVKIDLTGKRLLDYVIIFFDKENIAKEFIDLVDGTEFNRCILKPEILANRPNF
jgi:hypothetical protein